MSMEIEWTGPPSNTAQSDAYQSLVWDPEELMLMVDLRDRHVPWADVLKALENLDGKERTLQAAKRRLSAFRLEQRAMYDFEALITTLGADYVLTHWASDNLSSRVRFLQALSGLRMSVLGVDNPAPSRARALQLAERLREEHFTLPGPPVPAPAPAPAPASAQFPPTLQVASSDRPARESESGSSSLSALFAVVGDAAATVRQAQRTARTGEISISYPTPFDGGGASAPGSSRQHAAQRVLATDRGREDSPSDFLLFNRRERPPPVEAPPYRMATPVAMDPPDRMATPVPVAPPDRMATPTPMAPPARRAPEAVMVPPPAGENTPNSSRPVRQRGRPARAPTPSGFTPINQREILPATARPAGSGRGSFQFVTRTPDDGMPSRADDRPYQRGRRGHVRGRGSGASASDSQGERGGSSSRGSSSRGDPKHSKSRKP